jgi:hypothetical protein
MIVNVWIGRRVGIEIFRRRFDLRDMLPRMRAQQSRFGRPLRGAPFPIRMSIFQQRGCVGDSLRTLGMTRPGVFSATRIVENDHWPCKVRRPPPICKERRLSSRRVSMGGCPSRGFLGFDSSTQIRLRPIHGLPVMLSEAKHLRPFLLGFKRNLRFFASLRMTFMRWFADKC